MRKQAVSGVSFRPMVKSKYMTTKDKHEHPKDMVYCLDRDVPFVMPKDLISAYTAVYGENSHTDAMLRTSMPCYASQLLARELRKEGDRNVVLVIYGHNNSGSRMIVRLDKTRKEKLIDILENHPHQKSVDLIDKFADENPDIAEFEGGEEYGK